MVPFKNSPVATHCSWNRTLNDLCLKETCMYGLAPAYFSLLTLNLVCPSLVAQIVKNLPAVQETWVWSLGLEDPLKKGMATHFSILAWRIPWTEEPGGLQSMGSQRVGHDWATSLSLSLSDSSLLASRNATEFCVNHVSCYLAEFICSNSFCVKSLGFSVQSIMSYPNNDNFTLPFQI